jgi:monoamine oxidase
MLRFPRVLPERPLERGEQLRREAQDLRFQLQECRKKLKELKHGVAVVGGGFAGMMAAFELSQHGVNVSVYEARNEVGGRVRSNPTFAEGRITEEGAELIGSFHTRWLTLARRYGLGMMSRMDSDLYHQAGLDVKLTLDKPLSVPEFERLSKDMEKRILEPIALLAKGIHDPSRPWKQRKLLAKFDAMSVQDALPKFCRIAKRTKGNKDERLWKMIEFKLVNDEVSPLGDMNFLGLLCKVRGGQGKRFGAGLPPIRMGYWDELEIFRCADGCQQLAKAMSTEVSQKDGKIWTDTMVKQIDIAKDHVRLTWVPVRDGTPATGSGQSERFDFVIFAIPPSVWYRVSILENDRKIDPAVEIGQIGMAPAVKFFTDVKERFWIQKGAAPYGGSLKIGQVWEGTDNQMLVPQRQDKRGIVLSVFAGPLLPGPRVPTEKEFKDELPTLFDGFPANAKTLFANWPAVDFIETGYVNPKIGQLLNISEKLSKPYHDRLFFAGEHTQMDFFGYMEGALRSGEQAAHTLMLRACGLLAAPAAKAPGRSARTPAAKAAGPARRPTPARETAVVRHETRQPVAERSSAGDAGEAESPFLNQELFADSTTEEFESRAAALVAQSPFAGALDERPRSFDEEEMTEVETLDELEDAEEPEAERRWEETEEEPQTPEWIHEGSETPAIAETGGEVAVDDEAAVDEQLFEFEDDADALVEEPSNLAQGVESIATQHD